MIQSRAKPPPKPTSRTFVRISEEVFIPVSYVSLRTGIGESDLRKWMSEGVTPTGLPLRTVQVLDHRPNTAPPILLAQESLQKLEERFVDSTTGAPVGAITFEGPQPANHCNARIAARILGIKEQEMRQWMTNGISSNGVRLRVIEDTFNNRKYVASASLNMVRAVGRQGV